MQIRTCPQCGHKDTLTKYIKTMMFKGIDSSWTCNNCGTLLSLSLRRRVIVALISTIPLILNSFIRDQFIQIGLSKFLSWIGFALFYLLCTILIFSFDNYTYLRKNQKQNNRQI